MPRLISYSLLLSFFVLLTPRDFWHDCEHDEHYHELSSQHDGDELFQDDCFACDFDLGIISQPSFIQFSFEKQVFVNRSYTAFSLFTKDKFQHFSHRGPPTV